MSAQCLSGYEWSYSASNPRQSPCDVASQLAGLCVGTNFTLSPLTSGVVYSGPSPDSADSCRCSSVYYALLSACAYCQMRSYIRWSAYNTNCSTAYLQRFVESIPSGVKVPSWAYQDVSIDDSFNVTLARTNATNTRPSATPSGSSSNNSIDVAALAGGLVGGFIAIGLIVGFLSFWITRRSRRSARNRARVEANQTHDQGGYTTPANIAPYAAVPAFSSSVLPNPMPPISRVPMPQQAPHSLSLVDITNPFQRISPPQQPPSRQVVPFLDTSARNPEPQPQSEYPMTRITPYTVPSPTSPYTISSSQDSKQPLLVMTEHSSNYTDTHTSRSQLPTSSSNASYQQQQHSFPPRPLTSNDQLPSYADIMSGTTTTSRVPMVEK